MPPILTLRPPSPPQVLDVCASVTPSYPDLKEVALFLTAPGTLDAQAALGLYVRCGAAGGGEWAYRGCVHNGHPSEVIPLQVGSGVHTGRGAQQGAGGAAGRFGPGRIVRAGG